MFYRGPDNRAAALEDFCPHRGAPLSLGRVVEGKLVCGYHGLEMGCDGRTVAMPGQRVRGFPPIRAFPAVERHAYLNAAAASPTPTPVREAVTRFYRELEEGGLPIPMQLPRVPGAEISGVIARLGSDVDDWRVGDGPATGFDCERYRNS